MPDRARGARVFVVPHTHWDREWYEPFQVYRARLVRCMRLLLEIFGNDPEYRHFLLDGQTILLEDYAEVCPGNVPRLRRLIESGRIQIGPWYVLPDEFLVSGEAIIRNLLRGRAVSTEFGAYMPVGYSPDPFGHISQLPQILRGFEIDSAVFRRGLADEPPEILWRSPDGTSVLGCYLRDSYDNAAWLGHDDIEFSRGLDAARMSLAAHSAASSVLLLNGNDHMEPWPDLSRLLAAARRVLPGVEIIHASLPMYVEQVRSELGRGAENGAAAPAAGHPRTVPVVEGELRNSKRHHLLPGVASSRSWIKRRNAHAQMLLEVWAERLLAFSMFDTPAANGDALQLVRLAWKYLLQNHPHDSICGCGVDRTHEEMRARFDWVEQIAEPLIFELLSTIASRIDTVPASTAAVTATIRVPIVVFNPGAGPRTDFISATVEVPTAAGVYGSTGDAGSTGVDDKPSAPALGELRDDSGASIPYDAIGGEVREYYHRRARGDSFWELLGTIEGGRVMGLPVTGVHCLNDSGIFRVDVVLSEHGVPDEPRVAAWHHDLRELTRQNPGAVFDIRVHSPTRMKVEFVAPAVPAFGYSTFYLESGAPERRDAHGRPAKAIAAPDPSLEAGSGSAGESGGIENEFFRIGVDPWDGTLTIVDKDSGTVFEGMHRVVDGGDRGDLYNFCPPENDVAVRAPVERPTISMDRSDVRSVIEIHARYLLPEGLTSDRSARSSVRVATQISSRVSVYPGIRRIDFLTRVENTARDHRLQVEFPVPVECDSVDVGQAFDVVRRSLILPEDTSDWIEQPRLEGPMKELVSAGDGRVSVTVAAKGIAECSGRRSAGRTTLSLTLLRCVGWLSRDDLSTRNDHAGPGLETPGAQELGSHVFEYAVIPGAGTWRNAFPTACAFTSPMRAIAPGIHAGGDGASRSFVEVSPAEFVVTAIKPAEDLTGVIVRGYNISESPLDVTLTVDGAFHHASRARLDETDIEPIALEVEPPAIEVGPAKRRVAFSARGREIVTCKFTR